MTCAIDLFISIFYFTQKIKVQIKKKKVNTEKSGQGH